MGSIDYTTKYRDTNSNDAIAVTMLVCKMLWTLIVFSFSITAIFAKVELHSAQHNLPQVFDTDACNQQITTNGSYFQNPNYPEPYRRSGPCAVLVSLSGQSYRQVYQLRLDLEDVSLSPPNSDGICDMDRIEIGGTDSENIPQLCGVFQNQHMYVSLGDSDWITITVTSRSTYPKRWKVKITMVDSSAVQAPDGCLQYYYGNTSGSVKILGYNQFQPPHLANLDYTLCVRKEAGFRSIQWSACRSSRNAFTMTGNATMPRAYQDGYCQTDYIQIFGRVRIQTGPGMSLLADNIFCGTILSTDVAGTSSSVIYSRAKPFMMRVVTDSSEPEATDSNNIGFCLDYVHQPEEKTKSTA